jgi:septal ring factor EnvC (AmiA/AmiB activator)
MGGLMGGLMVGLIFLGVPVSAEEPAPAQLEELERTLEQESGRAQSLESEAQALAEDVARLQQELIAAARTAQDSEEEMSQLEATLAVLEEEAVAAEAELTARHGQLAAILGALQRLALQPPEAMLLGPATPLDTVRGATLLKVALPAVEGRARALKAELESLRQLRAEIDSRRQQLAGATARLDAERQRLAALVEEKRSLQQQTESERQELERRVAALGEQAADLKELMAHISLAPPPVPGTKPAVPGTPESGVPELAAPPVAEPAALLRLDRPPEIRPFPAAQASLTTPARGTVLVRYGEAGESGQSSKGIFIATRPQAQVVAPFDGQVMFRGPFRGYGEILILEHAGGYHTLLAGLGRTDAIVGQWLLAGEPVGIMGPAAGGNPELYLELRRDGQPINPLPWLDIRDSKTE